MENANLCIAMVPCPGFSHLMPQVEFAKRLVLHHPDFHVSFLIPTLGSPSPTMEAVLKALPPAIDFAILPQVNVEDLPQDAPSATLMHLTVLHSLPSLHHALTSLSSRTHLVALIADIFSVDALEIAKKFHLLSYVYHTSSATTLSVCFYFPKLDDVVFSFKDLIEPVKVPGCIAFKGQDMPDPFLDRSSDVYKSVLHICKKLHLADAIIENSFIDLEPEVLKALQEKQLNNNPPVYFVGPIIQTGSSSKVNGLECLTWLENQPRDSVLYVSFGSGGTLSLVQLTELAFGLEMSGHKFLWVVRAPNESSTSAAYLLEQKEDPLRHLPQGFLDRIKGQGLVVPSWAPQTKVLSHGSTGGFLSHCGWNSTLESLVCGKPLIVWPLFAEQRMNAVMLTDELKVAVRPKVNETGIAEREEIAKVIKNLMESDEGREIRKRIQGLKDAAAAATSEDGSSTRTLSSIALKWKNLSGS